MASIKIANLQPAGADLFNDSESYMMNLSEDELYIQGGISWTLAVASSVKCAAGVAFVAGAAWGWFAN